MCVNPKAGSFGGLGILLRGKACRRMASFGTVDPHILVDQATSLDSRRNQQNTCLTFNLAMTHRFPFLRRKPISRKKRLWEIWYEIRTFPSVIRCTLRNLSDFWGSNGSPRLESPRKIAAHCALAPGQLDGFNRVASSPTMLFLSGYRTLREMQNRAPQIRVELPARVVQWTNAGNLFCG